MTAPCSPELLAALRLVRDGGTLPEGDAPDGIGFAFLTRDCLSSVGEVLLATAEALELERLKAAHLKAKMEWMRASHILDISHSNGHSLAPQYARVRETHDAMNEAEAALRAAGGEP